MRRLVLIIALLVVGAGAILADTLWWGSSISQSVARGSGPSIPVMTDKARRADVPIPFYPEGKEFQRGSNG